MALWTELTKLSRMTNADISALTHDCGVDDERSKVYIISLPVLAATLCVDER